MFGMLSSTTFLLLISSPPARASISEEDMAMQLQADFEEELG